MDFFNINNENILKEEKEQNIIIWTRKPKKTINTCMTGWNIDNTKLKEIHKRVLTSQAYYYILNYVEVKGVESNDRVISIHYIASIIK